MDVIEHCIVFRFFFCNSYKFKIHLRTFGQAVLILVHLLTLHPLQAANCCRNSRLVVDEDDLKWVENEKNIVIIKTLP